MIKLGEIRKAREIGKYCGRGGGSFIWQACEDCGKERWVQYCVYKKEPRNRLCKSCAAKKNINNGAMKDNKNGRWNGGRTKRGDDYIEVRLNPDEWILFHTMATVRGYVREHRLVMAKYLNRCLLPWEVVHHKNGIRDDNRIENLELLSSESYHVPSKLWQWEILKRDNKIINLENQIIILKKELRIKK